MPNHFTTIGFASRNWQSLEDAGLKEFDFSVIEGKNLCELSCPTLPDELQGIVCAYPPCRFVHKKTKKVYKKDCNGPMKNRDKYDQVNLTEAEIKALVAKYGASNWYEWNDLHWGTKWGTYGTKVHELDGDLSPILIEFQSAWGPPSPEAMKQITDYLCTKCHLKEIHWMGHDPYDCSIKEIEVST